ncbi:MAG: DUF6702 family protein, partial [Planctomycetota bacterium]
MMPSMLFSLLLFGVLCHPFHTTVGEAQWNPRSGHLEVAVRIEPRDLKLAIADFERAANPQEIRVDNLEDAKTQKRIAAYLREHLRLQIEKKTDAGPARWVAGNVRWVGAELNEKGNQIWAYLELERPTGKEQAPLRGDLYLENRIGMQQHPLQINTMTLVTHKITTPTAKPDSSSIATAKDESAAMENAPENGKATTMKVPNEQASGDTTQKVN